MNPDKEPRHIPSAEPATGAQQDANPGDASTKRPTASDDWSAPEVLLFLAVLGIAVGVASFIDVAWYARIGIAVCLTLGALFALRHVSHPVKAFTGRIVTGRPRGGVASRTVIARHGLLLLAVAAASAFLIARPWVSTHTVRTDTRPKSSTASTPTQTDVGRKAEAKSRAAISTGKDLDTVSDFIDPNSARRGDLLLYRARIHNPGEQCLRNVRVQAYPPSGADATNESGITISADNATTNHVRTGLQFTSPVTSKFCTYPVRRRFSSMLGGHACLILCLPMVSTSARFARLSQMSSSFSLRHGCDKAFIATGSQGAVICTCPM